MTYNELLEWHFDFSVAKLELKKSTDKKDKKLLKQVEVVMKFYKPFVHSLDNKENSIKNLQYKSAFVPPQSR